MIWLKKKLNGLFNKKPKKRNPETSVEFRQMTCPYHNFICLQFPLRTDEEKRNPEVVCNRCKIRMENGNADTGRNNENS